ncbi:MAG: diguanylate cyclase [Sphingomonadales bacterium]|nr:diguanylate cyclase [Sphingomonadales bacterium]MDE2169577.1 diguanylate cyclase [Sphingomonadales bacterium]
MSLFHRAVAQAGIGYWSCDLADTALNWTPGVYSLFGLCPGQRLDRREIVLFYEEESRAVMESLRAEAIAHARPFTMEAQISRPDGQKRWMRLSADVIREGGRVTRLFGLKQDITQERLRWEELRRLAERDALTGLYNRTAYDSTFLNNSGAGRGGTPIGALVLIDLDHFKQINDCFGHAAGDACLRATGRRLATAFADARMVARIGGDEFAVLSSPDLSLSALEARIAQLLVDVARPVEWRGQRFTLGASVGIAPVVDPQHYDVDELFSVADTALYTAKSAGKGAAITGTIPVPSCPSIMHLTAHHRRFP